MNDAQPGAHVHVVRGAPDEVELAALVAGLVAASSQDAHGADDHAPVTSAWSDRRRVLRGATTPRPGPDAWRWSLRG